MVVKVSLKTSTQVIGIGLACVAQGVQELNYICEKEKELIDCDRSAHKLMMTCNGTKMRPRSKIIINNKRVFLFTTLPTFFSSSSASTVF